MTLEEMLNEQLTVNKLKPLAGALQKSPPTRKDELVALLLKDLLDPLKLRKRYEALSATEQAAIQEAVHAHDHALNLDRFEAKYGQVREFGKSEDGRRGKPAPLDFFFPGHYAVLPSDLQTLLQQFVPRPKELKAGGTDELPAQVRRPHVDLGSYWTPDPEEVPLTVRPTARGALHDVMAVLRLIDAGDVRVSDKTRRPSKVAMKAVAAILMDGEYYQDEDRSEYESDPGYDLGIKAFAWPMLVQAAGLAEAAGTKLHLTAAGRKATTQPAHEVIRQIWEKWLKTKLLDEFNRIEIIKGQHGSGRNDLTPVAGRREAIVATLTKCPTQQWLSTEELFRLLKASARGFQVSHNPWGLYLFEQQYGSFGYNARYPWEALQGRYTLAFLFEYAATLGLSDVAYIPPAGSRNDFHDRWGADDLSCLSRYDGLMFLRINSLGAWCLGRSPKYQPEAVASERVLKVLPNLDVVAANPPLSPADVLFLDRFAERKSDAVWHLSSAKVLEAVEKGLAVAELRDFLTAKSQETPAQTVTVFLDDVEKKASQLEDLGTVRLIACQNAIVAQTLVNDRRLRDLCQLTGDRQLVFRTADEAAVRRGLREIGYVLPPPK